MSITAIDHHTAVRLDGVTMEGAFTVAQAVARERQRGREVFDLSIGEPGFATPPHIVAAAVDALRAGDTRYAPPAGLPELRHAIARSRHTVDTACTADNVVVTPGAKPALLYAILALADVGSEVLVPDPGFPAYAAAVRLAGATPVAYPAGRAFDIDELHRRVTGDTRLIVLNGPHNPSGASQGEGELAAIAELSAARDIRVLSDEIYARIWFGEGDRAPSIISVPGAAERTVVVDGFSKSHSMTGWRLGFAVAPAPIAAAITRVAVNAHSCVAPFVQRAGIAALDGPDPVPAFVAQLRARRDLLVTGLNAIRGINASTPDGAFYVLADLGAILDERQIDAATFADLLLREHGVAVVPGEAFGDGGAHCIRLSFTPPANILAAAVDSIRACAAGGAR